MKNNNSFTLVKDCKLCKSLDYKEMMAYVLNGIGFAYSDRGDYKKAAKLGSKNAQKKLEEM